MIALLCRQEMAVAAVVAENSFRAAIGAAETAAVADAVARIGSANGAPDRIRISAAAIDSRISKK